VIIAFDAFIMQLNLAYSKTSLLSFLSNPKVMRWGKRLLFTAGLLLFTCVQFALVILPIANRTAPVETDDAYAYILKAAEMQNCFLQDCPALNDLREQLTAPAEKPHISWLRYREYLRAFSVYHPLHSLILTGLHITGLSWETSYHFVEIVGSLFLSLGIGYWLYRLFGAGPAGIALLFLAFTPFPNQGLHYVVPSNLALGIGVLTWGSLLKRPASSRWIVIGSTLALVTMHPLGRLYALLSVFLFVFLNLKQMKRMDWLVSGLSILIVVITFTLPLLVTRPELSFPADPPPADWKIWQGYYNNIIEAAAFITSWLNFYGGSLIAILFVFVGLVSLARFEQRASVLGMAVLLAGLLCVSLLQVLPRYPAEAFGRVWIPSAIFLSGVIAYGIWRWAAAVLDWSRQLFQDGFTGFTDQRWILSRRGWAGIFLLLFGIVLTRTLVNNVVEGRSAFRSVLSNMIESQSSRLAAEQASILLRAECKDVLYMFEVPMHVYFTNGAFTCGAIYYPAVAGTPEETYWIEENQNLTYVVTWNPTIQATVAGGGNPLALKTGDRLEFHIPEHWGSQHVYVYLENRGGEARLEISPLQKQETLGVISIPADWSGWQVVDITPEELAHGFSLDTAQVSQAIFLRGIKSDSESLLNWPWDQGMVLFYQRSNSESPATEISFNTAELVPYSNWSLSVLDDQGDTVLIKVDR
jgi:hypothetical protein